MLALTRRTLAVGLLTVFLAACKVVPETRPGPAPAPTQAAPDENVLPTDPTRHRIALLVPLSGENATREALTVPGTSLTSARSSLRVNNVRTPFFTPTIATVWPSGEIAGAQFW